MGALICNDEGELVWFLSVRYTYDKVTSTIGCNHEVYIEHLLVKYGMTECRCVHTVVEFRL